jgi:hypothetical protein
MKLRIATLAILLRMPVETCEITSSNEAEVFIRGETELKSKEIFNSGRINIWLSSDISYSKLLGGGEILAGNYLRMTKIINGGTEPVDAISLTAPVLATEKHYQISGEREGKKSTRSVVENSNVENLRRKVAERFSALTELDATLANLSFAENSLEENSAESFDTFGSANRIYIMLTEAGAENSETESIMSNPWLYSCLVSDYKIADLLREFYDDDDSGNESEIIKSTSFYAAFWEYYMKRLGQADVIKILKKLWKKASAEVLSRDRNAAETAITSGGGRFFFLADSLGISSGIEGFSELISRFGVDEAAGICDDLPEKRRRRSETFNFIRKFVSENGIGKIAGGVGR